MRKTTLMIAILALCCILYGFIDYDVKAENRQGLKDYFLYSCMAYGFKELDISRYDHSGSYYLDMLRYDPEALNVVRKYAEDFVDKIPESRYEGETRRGIIVHSIIEYNGKELDKFVKSLDKYIME